ncbi:Pantothenate precursors transporter PanS [Neolewinella maritima]|uniref:Pantothenates transporter PanS n=1 Tax=Neolewinella maritima TaxID=1383882 RepID=A0ABM9AZZ4_9BACT|nr:bile acid:sodium symporter [Neolewinella maritima]CAH0999796.1 Pantothenate precursors transporter PanS [Neolewinella maritima]
MLDFLIAAVLALIMFSIGLSLRPNDFRHLILSPKALFTGLFLQLFALPVLAFTVTGLSEINTSFGLGFLVLAACPGGLSSNMVSFLLRANTALAVSLTLCNSLLSVLTVPILVNLALDRYAPPGTTAHLPLIATALRICLIVLLPVLVGMAVRYLLPNLARSVRPYTRRGALLLLASVFLLKLFAPVQQGGSALTLLEVRSILPIALLINVSALSLGKLAGMVLRLGRDNELTLGVEVGIQNTSLAFLIAGTFLHNEQALKPALIYAMFTFFTALAYGLLLKPHMREKLYADLTGW